jgi:hypothetical protein
MMKIAEFLIRVLMGITLMMMIAVMCVFLAFPVLISIQQNNPAYLLLYPAIGVLGIAAEQTWWGEKE